MPTAKPRSPRRSAAPLTQPLLAARHSDFSPWLAAAIVAVWCFTGVVGHGPWRPDETYTMAIVKHMADSGQWLVPMLAGEPFMEKPPFFFWVATSLTHLLSPWLLAFHDAARLASSLFMAVALVFTGLSAKLLYGREQAWVAMLSLCGCLGLLFPSHLLVTDNALIAGFAIGVYGLSLARTKPVLAAAFLGTGGGLAFMSKGLIVPVFLSAGALLLPLFPSWRHKNLLKTLLLALLFAAPWLLLWPLWLYQHSQTLFLDWFWVNNFGRYLGFGGQDSGRNQAGFYLLVLLWSGWPAWFLALRLVRLNKVSAGEKIEWQMPLVLVCVAVGILLFSYRARPLYLLPALVPLALLASAGLRQAPRSFSAMLDWFGLITFGTAALLLWGLWVVLVLELSPQVAQWYAREATAVQPQFAWGGFVVSLVLTVLWVVIVRPARQSAARVVLNWSAGLSLVWSLAMVLWLPVLDGTKSYESVVAQIESRLDKKTCLASSLLGETHRAMLFYYGDISTRRLEVDANALTSCDQWLVLGSNQTPAVAPRGWKLVWEGSRPSQTDDEKLQLFEKL